MRWIRILARNASRVLEERSRLLERSDATFVPTVTIAQVGIRRREHNGSIHIDALQVLSRWLTAVMIPFSVRAWLRSFASGDG